MKSFITRTISAIVFAALMIGGLLWSPIPYCVVFSFIIWVMMKEYLDITLGNTHKIGKYFAVKYSGMGKIAHSAVFFDDFQRVDAKFIATGV